MKFRSALLGATILALPLVANAQPITGLYVGGGAGVDFMQDEAAKVTTPAGHTIGHWMKSNAGPDLNLSLGYGLGNGFRAELEGSYIYDNLSGGNEQKYGPMVNVLYDFVGVVPMVQPYVGLGAGYLWAKDDDLHFGPATFKTDAKGAFAYQAILGAALPIASAPGLSLTADYRFLGLAGGDRSYAGVTPGSSVKLSNDFTHMVTVGFTYAFGAAPAPAPMAPMPAAVPASPVSRSYLVFFDWDKAVLTDRAKQIVSEAAANSTKVQYTKIEVNGYTDTSGTPAYNQGLSVRRAKAVAAELVKDGVPTAAITIAGFGETHPLVPTGAGVREPQNRRVEIIIK
jgi:outer membrane protein OmpA-like peptidoglycan-associated protein